MGDQQRRSPEEQISFAREAFEDGHDFTIAVEEEFALLDPETLELTNRFEELKAGAAGTSLDEHLVGGADRIRDRGEDRSLRELR